MSNNTKLAEILNSYKVGELKELAKASGISGYSKLKKAELVDTVSKQLQSINTTELELPAELQAVLSDTKEVPAKTTSSQEDKATEKKITRSSTPIIDVAPHVINVRQDGQAPLPPINHPFNSVKKIYPNEPCFCGSGKKYKKCCGRF